MNQIKLNLTDLREAGVRVCGERWRDRKRERDGRNERVTERKERKNVGTTLLSVIIMFYSYCSGWDELASVLSAAGAM